MRYADSSFLVSLFVKDGNSPAAKQFLFRNSGPVLITSFSKSETFHAIRTMVFKKRIDLGEMTRALLQFDQDEASGALLAAEIAEEAIFAKADQLSNRHAAVVRRSLS